MANEQRTKYVRAMWKITEALHNETELEDALSLSLEVIIDTIGCQAGSVWFVDKSRDRVQAAYNVGTESIAGISVSNGEGIVGSVTKSGKSLIVADTSKDSRFSKNVDEETGFVTKSIICVPLKDEYETVGAIEVINKKSGDLFTREDLDLCEQMAGIAAIVIEDKGLAAKMQPEKKKLISLRDVRKNYRSDVSGAVAVLRGLNLDIYDREFLVILGESGSGKTTLLKMIGGIEKMSGGSFIVEGTDYSKASDKKLTELRREYVGFIFQSFDLMPNLTAKQNVELIADISSHSMSSTEALAMVGLSQKVRNYPYQLSRGQQQRVSIARAIAKNPKLILADEPTASLDFAAASDVLEALQNAVRKQGKTCIVVTHNSEIAKMGDRVVRIKNGQVASIKVNMHPLSASEVAW